MSTPLASGVSQMTILSYQHKIDSLSLPSFQGQRFFLKKRRRASINLECTPEDFLEKFPFAINLHEFSIILSLKIS